MPPGPLVFSLWAPDFFLVNIGVCFYLLQSWVLLLLRPRMQELQLQPAGDAAPLPDLPWEAGRRLKRFAPE